MKRFFRTHQRAYVRVHRAKRACVSMAAMSVAKGVAYAAMVCLRILGPAAFAKTIWRLVRSLLRKRERKGMRSLLDLYLAAEGACPS